MRAIVSIILFLLFSNFYCTQGLHYSKFNYYKEIGANEENVKYLFLSNKEVECSISNIYSCLWRKKYYIPFQLKIENNTLDTLLFDKCHISLFVNGHSFEMKPTYTMIDKDGIEHPFKSYLQPDVFKVAPKDSVKINFSFMSKERLSEKEYKSSFLNDTVNIKYTPAFFNESVIKLIGNNGYRTQ